MEEFKSEVLKELGLNASEIEVYLFLLENGISSPIDVSKNTKILRTNCYGLLNNLIDKGLVEEQNRSNKKKYLAKNPRTIMSLLDSKREKVEKKLLPELMGLYKSQKNKPVVKFFEGKEEIQAVAQSMYNTDQVLGFASTNKVMNTMRNFWRNWRKDLKKNGIILKDILSEPSLGKEIGQSIEDMGALFDYKIIPGKYDEVNIDILIWDDNVLLFTIEEPIFGTQIQNKAVADAFRVMHKIMWDSLGNGR